MIKFEKEKPATSAGQVKKREKRKTTNGEKENGKCKNLNKLEMNFLISTPKELKLKFNLHVA